MNKNNPLTLRTSTIPFKHFSAADIQPAIDTVLAEAKQQLAAIKQPRNERTFENTMLALDELGLSLDFTMGIISHLESVATTPDWRAAYNEVLPLVTQFHSEITLDRELWHALCEYSASQEASTLSPHRKRFLEKTLDSFRRHGAELSEEDKVTLTRINNDLAKITTTFSQNTLDATNAFEYVTTDEAELAGLPASALMMGKVSAKSKNVDGWRYTLQAPSVIAILTYAENRTLRETFYKAYNARCASGELSNRKHLLSILTLRAEKAALLGFSDFSDLVLADRMAKSGTSASNFVEQLREHVEPHFYRENEELERFVKETFDIDPTDLRPWDIGFYTEKLRKALYDFDEEALRPYFPLPTVMKGLFTLVERLFGIRFEENNSLECWDEHVRAYSAYDTKDNTLLGHFYSDLFPRENKRGGAWMNSMVTHAASDGAEFPHVGLIAGNFTPPSESTPALLTHNEVTTLFHEFGHLLHLLCNTTELRSQSMSAVAWDFIELPSQILENWCWERESLNTFAKHHESGEALPDTLFEKLLKARTFRNASHIMRQVGFSTVDLALHRNYEPTKDGDVTEYARAITQRFSPLPLPEDYSMILTFTHLFSSPVGYAAGYYSYQWSEVLDADAFSKFREDGIFNQATGTAFRKKILSQGDSQDAETLYTEFRGRKAQIKPLLERAGLL
jgi:oligopeptidase A